MIDGKDAEDIKAVSSNNYEISSVPFVLGVFCAQSGADCLR